MRLGLLTDCLEYMPLPQMLETATRLGVTGLELGTGGRAGLPHVEPTQLLTDPTALSAFQKELSARGQTVLAINAHGNPLHPKDRAPADRLVNSLRLAGALGVDTVVANSGLPAGNATDTTPNWMTSSFSQEQQRVLRYQWDDVLLPFWTGIAALARENGVKRLAITLAANHCVHNAPTLMNLREIIGPSIGANLDVGQILLLGADPMRVVGQLDEAIYNVHVSDVMFNCPVQSVTSMIDTSSHEDIQERAWRFITPGYGHGADWWAKFFYHLEMAEYEGSASVVHLDPVVAPVDALQRALRVVRSALPREAGHLTP